jgi:hypothetical protein
MIKVEVTSLINRVDQYTASGMPMYWWGWCKQQFGPPNNSKYSCPATEIYWGCEYDDSSGRSKLFMCFKDPAHATAFALRWL